MNYIHNNKNLRARRQELRRNATPEEKKLWWYIKSKKLGYQFYRQHSIGPYIVDFYCSQTRLVIELDGSQHLENREYDKERTKYFESLNCVVLRFWNNEINNDVLPGLPEGSSGVSFESHSNPKESVVPKSSSR